MRIYLSSYGTPKLFQPEFGKPYSLLAHTFYVGTVLLQSVRPILLYDNDCGICSRFAHIAERTSKGWIDTVGLFTKRGVRIKSDFFSPGDRPDENFWLLVGDVGYGGRSGLLPLAREIVRGLVL